jgi:hypothetical protein
VLGGVDPAEAWRRLNRARGLPVPETDEQHDGIADLRSGR